LNTAGSYYGWAKRAEGHRISAIHYARLYRAITVELALPREERMQPHDFLKYVKDQYDRLQEISPLLPTEVINEFQHKFANEKEISKPEEANGLEKIVVFRGDEVAGEPSSARTPQFKLRTPKFGTPKEDTTIHMKNPMIAAGVPALLQTVIQPREPQTQQGVSPEVAALAGMAAVAMASDVLRQEEAKTSS
jgi:hypothetical protein